jgi:3',5'-cyclic AMP phosphodiesterase CpdA
MPETRILHLSDLHFGRNFQKQKWTDLVRIAKSLAPDLIIITGDIVNTPWRWTLKRANRALLALENDLEFKLNNKRIVFVPGNHDTRISGLFSISWLLGTGAISALLSTLFFFNQSLFAGSVLGILGLTAFVLRLCTTRKLEKYLGSFLLKEPLRLDALGVGILPFDSASAAKLGAHGRFPAESIQICRHALNMHGPSKEDASKQLFWIAAVHHHVLPLPYDAKHEAVMIMENAGTLLQELITHSVPLILHGHKHHQHFSKLMVKTRDGVEKQIAVLAAGTPTENFEGGTYQHSFNFLEVSEVDRVDISVYRSNTGGSFGVSEKIALTSENEYSRRRFARFQREKMIYCEQMFSSAVIDRFGNAKLAREFSGVRTKSVIDQFPHDFPATCQSGEIVDIWVSSPRTSLPSVWINHEYDSDNTARCTVNFGGRFAPENGAIDFHLAYEAINAFALDSIQFSQMYPGHMDNLESAAYAIPDCIAVKELLLQLRFPEGMKVPPNLMLKTATEPRLLNSEGRLVPDSFISIVHGSSMVLARIPSPSPGSIYCFSWQVEDLTKKPNLQRTTLERALIDKNLSVFFKSQITQFLDDALLLAEETLVEPFPGLQPDEIRQHIRLTLYGYDRKKGLLKAIATAGPERLGMGREQHRYGLGLAGHAFKSGKIVVYDKNSPESFAERYVRQKRRQRIADDAPTQTGPAHAPTVEAMQDGDSSAGASVAVPIYLPTDITSPDFNNEDFRAEPYAVVQVSFDEAIGKIKLSDTYHDPAQSIFQAAMSQTVQNLINETILNKK